MKKKGKPNRSGSYQRKKSESRSAQPKKINTGQTANETESVIFGVLPVLEALRAENRRIEKILVAGGPQEKRFAEIFELARQKGVLCQRATRENLSQLVTDGANHQGIVALAAAAEYFDAGKLIETAAAREGSLTVILDGVEDPRNLGAILRVSECAGVDGVFIPERRAVGLTETVAKAAAGATEYVKVAKVTNINRLIDELKENNIWVIGSSGEAQLNYTDWDWTRSTALVLGSEGSGMHRLTAEKCDQLVKIPLKGRIESLNVSVAAGVILFEAVRQRNGSKK